MQTGSARWIFLLFVTLSIGFGRGSSAAEIGVEDARAVRSVVEAQLDALAVDDEVVAFSFASPAIRKQFGDATQFMVMVRASYPMLIRPAATVFLRARRTDDGLFQPVHLRDRAGHSWRAIYLLRQQPDRAWRIDGCAVSVEEDGTEI